MEPHGRVSINDTREKTHTTLAEEAMQIAGKTGTAQVARLSPAERLSMLDDIETLDWNYS